MSKEGNTKSPEAAWIETWLSAVVSGESTMSQRKLSVIESRGGGLAKVRAAARRKRVHLLVLTDDKGNRLVAASMNAFEVIC